MPLFGCYLTSDRYGRAGTALGQTDLKSGAKIQARTLCADRSSVQLHQAAHYSQAKTQAAGRSGRRHIGLLKAFEDVGKEVRRNALAAVAYCDQHVAVAVLD